MTDDTLDDDEVDRIQDRLAAVRTEVRKRLVGQEAVLDQVLACLLADGNALLESVPGLGKTMLVRTIAEVTDCSFSRVQNTPDLMPSDITGTEIIRETRDGREFTFEPGPIFANVVLADEINRATPKTQAALLEAMQERQVTAGGETRHLPDPFFVLATQNPVEQEGVYPLPEAQKDRFLAKVLVDYPDEASEREIVDRYTGRLDDTIPVEQQLASGDLLRAQELVRQVPIAEDIRDRVVELVRATRTADRLEYGASPRASMGLVVLSKARAFMAGRAHVTGEDVEAMARPVLRHRVVVDFRAERDGVTADDVIGDLL
ncbi:AAA family ATPase [Halorientalis regularis]|jgi:MoxR-like ATPase|uniref:MoxR-like ATPase n=1 Tax=Halorientalis regularis TaxID=660518 RepID=A0A1G7J9Q4_9EURY|nr:MoxR family ATPase [Halorientalis regularis]SDF21702.1 MoxR-like ATPase [Halorientalis regularis]